MPGCGCRRLAPSRRRLPHPRKQTSAQLKQCHLTGRRSGRNPYHVDARRHDGNAPTPALELEAGKPVKLEPGGLHLMLINLKKPLKEGDKVQFVLNFKQGKGVAGAVGVQATVKAAKAHAH